MSPRLGDQATLLCFAAPRCRETPALTWAKMIQTPLCRVPLR